MCSSCFSLTYQRSTGASQHLTLSTAAQGWAFKPSQLPVMPGVSPTGPDSGQRERRGDDSSFLDIILASRNNCWMPSITHTCCFTDTVLHKSIQTLKRVSLTFKNLHCNAHLWYLYFIKTETKKVFLYVALSYRNTNKTEILYLSKKSFYYYYFF